MIFLSRLRMGLHNIKKETESRRMRSRYIRTLAGIMAAALVIGGCGGTGNGGTSSDAAVQGQEGEADGSSETGETRLAMR